MLYRPLRMLKAYIENRIVTASEKSPFLVASRALCGTAKRVDIIKYNKYASKIADTSEGVSNNRLLVTGVATTTYTTYDSNHR